MNKTETVIFCRYIKAMCPAQAIDEYTPDAWADVLHDVTLEEAKTAAIDGIRNKGWRFVDVTDVVTGARLQRKGRIEEWTRQFGPIIPPRELSDDPAAGNRWVVTARNRILDGSVSHPSHLYAMPEVESQAIRRDVIAELGEVGRPVNGARRPADLAARVMPDDPHPTTPAAAATEGDTP